MKPPVGQNVKVSVGEFGAEYGKYTHVGVVDEHLSTQFTCIVDDRTMFFFYKDYGLTWELAE